MASYRTFHVYTGPSAFPADVVVDEDELWTLDHCDGCGTPCGGGLCSRCQEEDDRREVPKPLHRR